MKTVRQLSIIMIVFIGMWANTAFAQKAATAVTPLDKIVAVINSDVITSSELDKQIAMVKQQMQATGAVVPDAATLRKQILNQLIDQKLQLLVAQHNNIKVTDTQLDKAISGIAASNHMTVAQLQTAVAKQGMSFTQYRKQIRDQILIAQIQQGVVGRPIQITDQQVSAFLKKQTTTQAYHVQDLLVPFPSHATPAEMKTTEDKANTIYKDARAKNGFDNLMKNASSQGLQSIDMGWRSANNLPQIFATQIVKMQTGQVSAPIKAPNGYHLLMLAGSRSVNGPQGMTAAQARQILLQQAFEQKLKPWIAQLRKTAYVKIME